MLEVLAGNAVSVTPNRPGGEEAVGVQRRALQALHRAKVPFMVGGSVAIVHYTNALRPIKDLDLFLRPADFERTAEVLTQAGLGVERTHPHWLGKAQENGHYVDLIYNSGNGLMEVDDEWFAHSRRARLHGVPVRVVPPEELIWTKLFIMERERYDGGDVSHLMRDLAHVIDWNRLEQRVGEHWRVLLSHLVLFGYVFPSERGRVPPDLLQRLAARLHAEQQEPPDEDAKVCRGTLLSRQQYLRDVQVGGYQDARLAEGVMTEQDIASWTAAIAVDGDGSQHHEERTEPHDDEDDVPKLA